MNIITGYRGEPHITAQQDRDINIGIMGNALDYAYVLDVGQLLEAEIISANEIRIRDGVVIVQGCAASVDYGAYDALEISNGTLGMQRIDIIAAQYEKDNDTSIESISLVVVEGTPDAADPQPPALTTGNIQAGDTFAQVPLYHVLIDGISIDSIEQRFLKLASKIDVGTTRSGSDTKTLANTTAQTKLADIDTLPIGAWVLVVGVRFANNPTGTRSAQIYANGSALSQSIVSFAAENSGVNIVIPGIVGSRSRPIPIELYARQNSGASMNVSYYWRAIRVG